MESFMWKLLFDRVTLSFWALQYCINVKNTRDVRNCITNPYAANEYYVRLGNYTPDGRLTRLSKRPFL